MLSGDQENTGGAGRLLAGRYRVVAQLGRGGMGVVWRAVDEVLHREVAVKELRTFTDAAGGELADLRLRMQREARAAARVRHPGVVAVHDVAEEDGRPLIVMELVEGPSLDDVLRERGTLEPREAAAVGAKVMEALAAAHRAGVLHRDVKPGNILLENPQALGSARAGEAPLGRVVLTDFGIATMEDPGDGSSTHLTRSGELIGSLDYLAPERAQGHDPGPASDVWALGATLYAAVEGDSPFRRTSTWSTLTAIVVDPLPEPRRSGPLTPVLRQLMDKDPQARPDAAAACALLATVAAAAGDVGTAALREAPGARPRTERSIPNTPPPGFGPPPGDTRQPVPPASVPQGPPAVHLGATRTTQRPRRGRALLAAVAVAVVLAATGVTVAVLNGKDDSGSQAREGTAQGEGADRADDGGSDTFDGGSTRPKPSKQGDEKPREADPKPDGGKGKDKGEDDAGSSDQDKEKPSDREKGGDKPSSRPDPTTKPTGGPSGGGGGGSEPDPVCHPAGGGKYNCSVWRTAKSYTASGAEAGSLNSGTNYFYCQQNQGRRETYGRWTNVWWAKTDDDSGNRNVFVSDVYITGGDNDKPLPGLPTC
ncbi:serine/threonine-protein kinase [Streptomyces kanamyceticus]|uniref:non-specific serine/threonine protein kinase n=1 Tax=Streptomyces kanamyceticus TaxID=1967 RepID=A0A5J6GQK6_STRKN|nr:serine/threonine-protein kinase [Streptomyces kanamyceticus]QEU96038.1 serine/threonine protein kinase [Streptomyces kanamyceticus]